MKAAGNTRITWFSNVPNRPPRRSPNAATRGLIATILVVGTWGWNAAATAEEAPADLILFNGKIFTSDRDHPYVQAVAIRGERIIAVGDSEKIRALRTAGTRPIDLGGRTVIPGINDAHNHIDIHPANFVEVELRPRSPTKDDLRKELPAAAATIRKTGSRRAILCTAFFRRDVYLLFRDRVTTMYACGFIRSRNNQGASCVLRSRCF